MSAKAASHAVSNPGSGAYELTDELAQFCLPRSTREAGRGLAWLNAVCAAFLITGIVGIRSPISTLFVAPVVEEPILNLPPPEPPPTEPVHRETLEMTSEPTVAEAPVVEVPIIPAADPSTVTFGIEVPGVTIKAATPAAAAPPPSRPARGTPSLNPRPSPGPAQGLRPGASLGDGGEYPMMTAADYPREARERKEQGEVVLTIEVAADGKLVDVRIKRSSGSRHLDRAAENWVRRRFRFPAGEHRIYDEVPFEFILR